MPSVSGNAGAFLLAQKTLTHAQILALPTTAITLVAAPKATQMIVPIHAVALLNWHADYTNIDAAAQIGLQQSTLTGGLLAYANEAITGNTGASPLLANGEAAAMVFGPLGTPGTGVPHLTYATGIFTIWPSLAGLPVQLAAANAAAGNFTGGDVADTLLVSVAYYVLDLPT